MIVLHLTGPLADAGSSIHVEGSVTMRDLQGMITKQLGVSAGDVEMFHEGVEVGVEGAVFGSALCDGDEVEVRPSRRFEAKRVLQSMGVTCSLGCLMGKVLRVNQGRPAAAIVQLMIDAEEGILCSTDEFGSTALSFAAACADAQVVRVLLQSGADPNASSPGADRNPLTSAVLSRDSHLTQMLLEYGAVPDAPDGHNRTPLWIACQNGSVTIGRVLLASGADPLRKGFLGKSPFDLAREHSSALADIIAEHLDAAGR